MLFLRSGKTTLLAAFSCRLAIDETDKGRSALAGMGPRPHLDALQGTMGLGRTPRRDRQHHALLLGN